MSNIGFIYKIENDVDDEIYVGSTIKTLNDRFCCHKSFAKDTVKATGKLYDKMRTLGVEHFKIVYIETVTYNEKYELYERENFYIEALKAVLNCVPAPQKDRAKSWSKQYYQENKERIIERVHRYAENNKEQISERSRNYREKHNDEIKAKKGKKCVCDCGVEYTHAHQSRHLRTKAHLENMKSKEPTIEAPEPEVII